MSKDDEPPDRVECWVCGKKINIAAKRKIKKVNDSGPSDLLKIRQLRDGNYVCSDICFNLATQPPSEPFDFDPG